MSPMAVRKMPWLFFIDLLIYKNKCIEEENKAQQESLNKMKKGRKRGAS